MPQTEEDVVKDDASHDDHAGHEHDDHKPDRESDSADVMSGLDTLHAKLVGLGSGKTKVEWSRISGPDLAIFTKLADVVDAIREGVRGLAQKAGDASAMLPALTEKAEAEIGSLSLALASAEEHGRAMAVALNRVERQRDEFDSMLRKEEQQRQQAQTDAKSAQANASRYRLEAMRASDPRKGTTDGDGFFQVRLRVMAWLGNSAAQAELGLEPNVCPLCRGSPACYVDPRLPNPHGTLLPAEVMRHLRDVVAQALSLEKDPTSAVDAWASGSGEIAWDQLPARKAPAAKPAASPSPPVAAPPSPAAGWQAKAKEVALAAGQTGTASPTSDRVRFDPAGRSSRPRSDQPGWNPYATENPDHNPNEKGTSPNEGAGGFKPGSESF